ncbi:hypothetical protein GN958_ATG02816 [Phytophthora infestans]|uniref:Uncharacterized protein n=1 Tax=Phytophthora infestans TaxID=4787 RepID=A0A8S9V3G7_PHYIN|nr:hypothetical protein GN958_ATG02816 [Phytophthora infestans]
MPSSEDSSASRHNTWTLDEFADLVVAWELATSRPRDASAQTLHDAVFKHFVARRGGSTRRNKAALTSKRSALKFSYLYIREFDNEQKLKKLPTYFELPISKRIELLISWKRINSSLVEISHVMFQGLGRIVSKGGDDEPILPIRKRQKELQEATHTTRTEPRPTRASSTVNSSPSPTNLTVKPAKTKHGVTARSTSNPWSSDEMKQLVKAWGIAAQTVCDSKSGEPMSIVHEMFRQFENLQQGRSIRNLSGLATRRRVLKQSYSRISAFDKIQEMNGEPKFTDLPATSRQSLMRSWKNANLLDLSPEMYAELHHIITLDTRAVALEDIRRARATGSSVTGRGGRKPGRPLKKQRTLRLLQDDDVDSNVSSQPPSVADDSEEEKGAIPLMIIQSRAEDQAHSYVPIYSDTRQPTETMIALTSSTGGESPIVSRQDAAPPKRLLPAINAARTASIQADRAISVAVPDRVTHKPLAPKPIELVEPTDQTKAAEEDDDAPIKSPGRWGKRKRKVHPDGPNGHLWENKELQILIDAWEKAAILVCNSDPSKRLSLNSEMYREFVAMQGGSSVRNSTALAARRSSLKFSYAHIRAFNESQKAKGEPSFHEIPQDTRMNLLRSWKNRNSVDLTKRMYDTLGRILAMDEKLAEVRSMRPPPHAKAKKPVKSVAESSESKTLDANYIAKTAKWTTEESADLIRACADVMNAPNDAELSQTDRESLIFDAFVARREHAGDTDTPVRRDLRSMAQQWRYILASYTYIKACNDDRSEAESPSWFEMSAMQKRAYQQCTNVPLKFVDLDEAVFALVTKTSFVAVSTSVDSSPASKTPTEGISLRPRSTRKKMEAFWSSDSESSVSEIPTPEEPSGTKEPVFTAGKKRNNWPAEEIWNLIQAWEEASELTKSTKLTAAINEAYALFMKREGPGNRNRTLNSVRNKMIALNSSYNNIAAFIAEHGDSATWFNLTQEERLVEIRSWGNKTVIDLNEDMYNSMTRILRGKASGADDKAGKRKHDKPAKTDTKDPESKSHTGQKPDKYVAANWSKEELLKLGEACGELLEGRRSRRYVFEEEKDRFFRKYEELGGTNSLAATVGLARFVLDSYEFIYFYNQKAVETECLGWFELDLEDRDDISTRVSRSYRSFNGLTTVDEEIFHVIDKMDAELRVKLGETKKKTYKPPNDAASSRYVDIEAVVERCVFKPTQSTKKTDAPEEKEESEEEESDEEDEASDSDSTARSRPVRDAPTRVRRDSVASRKRSRGDADEAEEGSSTLYLTEIIQEQNRKLEEAVKRFRKESAVARKEHHDFLVRKIQDSFPVDSGHGSFLERVAERQGQTLADIFQRLQQQRDAEKAKDEELMRQLFA